ncbi:MAG: hypothetical protein [Bacteriophage sp.]|nr:MAG: hypothetical protein [Bacteriophage sp.]
MSNLSHVSKNIVKSYFVILFLKSIRFISMLLPKGGLWLRRLLFIMTTYHELQRLSLFTDLSLDRINCRLLKIKQTAVLSSVSDITQWNVIHLDADTLIKAGLSPKCLLDNAMDDQDIGMLTKIIIAATPKELQYDRSAMISDLHRLFKQDKMRTA